MKLIIAIISNKDTENVLGALAKAGHSATKISTTGQFLEDGHSCLLIGVKKEIVEDVMTIVQNNVTKRIVRKHGIQSTLQGTLLQQPIDVEENGGIAFVLDVEEFKKF